MAVVLITGATDGLGRALAHDLVGRGDEVLVHGRDPERLAATVDEIRAATGVEVASYRADLAELAQVRELADRVAADHPALDVLVNNAGIGADVPGGGERQESVDGHELRFAVNYLAGHLLTRRLLPSLQAAGTERGPARIVMVSSAGQAAIDFDDVMLERDYSGWRAYCQSKLAQILDAYDLADELDPERRHRDGPAPGHVHADEDRAVADQHDRRGRGGDGAARGGPGARGRHRAVLQRCARGPARSAGAGPAGAGAAAGDRG